MAAPPGNQFWKLRSKHGRDKIFSTPEILWEEAVKYFEWCDDNPLWEEKLFSSMGKILKGKSAKMRPYTLMGLCLYLDVDESHIRKRKAELEANNDERKKDFFTIIARIEKTIYQQKFAGAVAELMNPNIIARELGLAEKKITDNVHEIKDFETWASGFRKKSE